MPVSGAECRGCFTCTATWIFTRVRFARRARLRRCSARPPADRERLGGQWSAQRASRRAHLGLSRTYPIVALFNHDSLEHNVALGLLGLRPARWQMWLPLSHYNDLATAARRTLDAVGLLHLAQCPVSDIAYGEKRRVELAM